MRTLHGSPAVRGASFLLLAALLTVAACRQEEPPSGPRVPDPAAAVRSFNPNDLNASIDRLNRASFAPSSSVPSLRPLLEDPDPDRRWAAVYLAAILITQEDAEVLRPVLEDEDPSIRVMAAGALARLGVVESIPVLIEGLHSKETLPFSDPPRPTADLAREALEAYTGERFGSPEEWEHWWQDVEGSLRWDGERYVTT